MVVANASTGEIFFHDSTTLASPEMRDYSGWSLDRQKAGSTLALEVTCISYGR
jgi:hypothetical protein